MTSLILATPGRLINSASVSNFLFDSTNDWVAWRFHVADATALAKVKFRWGANTGSPGSMETILLANSGAEPSGGDLGGGSPTLLEFTPTPSDTDTKTFTNSYTPSAGDYVWVLLRPKSGETFDGSNYRRLSYRVGLLGSGDNVHGGEMQLTSSDGGSTWVTAPSDYNHCGCELLYTGDVHVESTAQVVITTAGYELWDGADNPDERGVAWDVPAGLTCKVHGIGGYFRPADADGDFNIKVYSDGGTPTELADLSIDISEVYDRYGSNIGWSYWFDQGPYSVSAGEIGRVTYEATHASSTIRLVSQTFDSQAGKEAAKVFESFWKCTRNNGAGSFTDNKAVWYNLFPWLEFEAAAGGVSFVSTRRSTLIGR